MRSDRLLIPAALAALLWSAGCTAPAAQPQADPTVVALAGELAAMRAEATARAAVTPTALPTATPAPTATLTPEQAVKPALDATVLVQTNRGNGSGVILASGSAVTSLHVVEGAGQITVQFPDKRTAPAQVVRTDRLRDLALLAVPTTETPAELGHAEGLQPPAPLMAVGYPLSVTLGTATASVTRGSFSGMRAFDEVWFVQTDAALNPGNSGGPLVDAQGRVAGIVSRKRSDAEGIGFAVAPAEVRVFLASADNPPPPPPATATPRPSPRQQFFAEFDQIIAVHEANRTRLANAYGSYRAGRLSHTAFVAEVEYQIVARATTRAQGWAMASHPAAAEPALLNAVADFGTALDMTVEYVTDERTLLARGVRYNDEATWKALEARGDATTARWEGFRSRFNALRR